MSTGPLLRPKRITVVRHGATEWSRIGRHTGSTDLPLLHEGETEALALRERLAWVRPSVVLASPLRRALDTCELAGFGERVEVTHLLTEMDYGQYEGLTTAEIRSVRPGWDLFRDGCPGGETIEQVGIHADAIIQLLTGDPELDGKDVLLFSHGHALRVVAARWLECPASEARGLVLGSGSFGVLGWEYEWRTLSTWNCR